MADKIKRSVFKPSQEFQGAAPLAAVLEPAAVVKQAQPVLAQPTSIDSTIVQTFEEVLPSATVAAERELRTKLDAITTTVDRSAVDQAKAAAKVAEEWLAEAESARTQAVQAYQAIMAKPFTTLPAYIAATTPLMEKAALADDTLVMAQGRAQVLRAKAQTLEAEYNATIRAKQHELCLAEISKVGTKLDELQQWFTEKCMYALRVTRGASAQPGPDVLTEYGAKFAELVALQGTYASAIGSSSEAPEPLTPEKIHARARFDGLVNPNDPQWKAAGWAGGK